MHRTTLSGSAAADGAAGSLDGDGSGADSSSLGAQPLDRRQLWKAAIKLPMYSVGVVPVLVSRHNERAMRGAQGVGRHRKWRRLLHLLASIHPGANSCGLGLLLLLLLLSAYVSAPAP